MVTGGFRTPNLLYSALRSGHTNMLGIGRCSILCPQIPNKMRDFEQRHGNNDGDIPFGATRDFPASDKWWPIAALWNTLSKIQLIVAGSNLAWYAITLRQLAIAELQRLEDHRDISQSTQEPDYTVDALRTFFRMFFWSPNTSWRRPYWLHPLDQRILSLIRIVLGYFAWWLGHYFFSFCFLVFVFPVFLAG